jgi:hypothetical protein
LKRTVIFSVLLFFSHTTFKKLVIGTFEKKNVNLGFSKCCLRERQVDFLFIELTSKLSGIKHFQFLINNNDFIMMIVRC